MSVIIIANRALQKQRYKRHRRASSNKNDQSFNFPVDNMQLAVTGGVLRKAEDARAANKDKPSARKSTASLAGSGVRGLELSSRWSKGYFEVKEDAQLFDPAQPPDHGKQTSSSLFQRDKVQYKSTYQVTVYKPISFTEKGTGTKPFPISRAPIQFELCLANLCARVNGQQ